MLWPCLWPRGKLLVSHDAMILPIVFTATALDLFLCATMLLLCTGHAPRVVLHLAESPYWQLPAALLLHLTFELPVARLVNGLLLRGSHQRPHSGGRGGGSAPDEARVSSSEM